MNVTVEYFGQLRQIAGAESEAGQPPDGTTVQAHLRELADRHGQKFADIVFTEDGQLRPSVMVLVNDAAIAKQTPRPLADGDCVKLLTAIAGG